MAEYSVSKAITVTISRDSLPENVNTDAIVDSFFVPKYIKYVNEVFDYWDIVVDFEEDVPEEKCIEIVEAILEEHGLDGREEGRGKTG